eukprot:6795903-Prymnesium_polylepis.1
MADAEQTWRAAGVLAHPDWYDLPLWYEHRWELAEWLQCQWDTMRVRIPHTAIVRDMWDAFVLLDNM